MINKDVLTSIIKDARTEGSTLKGIAFCSPGGHRILKYLYKTEWPDFSIAGAARQILEPFIESADNQVWSVILKELPASHRKHRDYWNNVPQLVNVREDIIKEVIRETPTYPVCIVQIYSPRLAVYFRYHKLINIKYSISKAASQIFENEMSRRYPALWNRIMRI